jgi:hypothetical protein
MKWHEALSGLMMSGTALLLPLTAMPESQIQTGSASAVSSATAHVNFKIVIPQVLYLQVGAGKAITQDAQCKLTPAPGGASPPGTHTIICTASKP